MSLPRKPITRCAIAATLGIAGGENPRQNMFAGFNKPTIGFQGPGAFTGG
jgi:hypothetical protein